MTDKVIHTVHVVLTGGVSRTMNEQPDFSVFVFKSLLRHLYGDWGQLAAEDHDANQQAVASRDRVLSSYPLPEPAMVSTNYGPAQVEALWVITDPGWETTTILWPVEY